MHESGPRILPTQPHMGPGDYWSKKRSKVKEIIVLIKARLFLDELNLEHLTS